MQFLVDHLSLMPFTDNKVVSIYPISRITIGRLNWVGMLKSPMTIRPVRPGPRAGVLSERRFGIVGPPVSDISDLISLHFPFSFSLALSLELRPRLCHGINSNHLPLGRLRSCLHRLAHLDYYPRSCCFIAVESCWSWGSNLFKVARLLPATHYKPANHNRWIQQGKMTLRIGWDMWWQGC